MFSLQKINIQIPIDDDEIVAYCQKWKITELALFGSVLRDDFQQDRSDVDVLVTFHPDVRWTLLDLVDMEDNLQDIFCRKVDLVERGSVEKSGNYLRKKEILESCRVIYVAS
jgi:predicted nucleotidyltransferase